MKTMQWLRAAVLLMVTVFAVSCDGEVEPVGSQGNNPPNTDECARPTNFQVSDFINGTSVNLNWVSPADSWEIQYGQVGFSLGSGTTLTAANNYYTVEGLDATVSYEFYIRSVCAPGETSEWVGPVAINGSSSDCYAPDGVSAIRTSDPTKITVTWVAGGEENSWKIEYGPSGFSLGTGTELNATSTSVTISGLQASQAYDFYVSSVCSATEESDVVGPVTVQGQGNTNYAFMNATINGTAYVGMMPVNYLFDGAYATTWPFVYGDDTLVIQGNTQPLQSPATNRIEIDLFIRKEMWHTGTFVLDPNTDMQSVDPINTVLPNIIITDSSLTGNYASELPGTITITEFNTQTRRIKGTFSFSYTTFSNEHGEEGPFQVLQGSFDYPIDPDVVF